MRKKKYRIILLCLATILLTIILSCYLLICINARGKTFNDVQNIPFNEVGLLLGTSPVTPNGEHNYYFDERIKATAALYHSGKIKRIIASGGDNSSNGGCNELIAMRDSLIKQEIPDSLITLDYQGSRTLNNTVMTALFRLLPCRAKCSTESRTCVPHWRKTMSPQSPTATPRTSLRSTADDNR